jgi:hypothetical protein
MSFPIPGEEGIPWAIDETFFSFFFYLSASGLKT